MVVTGRMTPARQKQKDTTTPMPGFFLIIRRLLLGLSALQRATARIFHCLIARNMSAAKGTVMGSMSLLSTWQPYRNCLVPALP